MSRFLPMLAWVVLLAGCSTIPFRETEPVSMEGTDPASLISRFRKLQPERFRTMSSVVFDFPLQKVSALGITDIDRREGAFTVVALNPMGVKLFEITGNADHVTTNFMLPAMAQRGDAAAAIGEDIRHIYFDLLPSAAARVEQGRYRTVFREPSGKGTLSFVFAGVDGAVIEKSYSESEEIIWKVRYYEYRREGGKDYPMGIVLDNFRHGYRLIVKVKEILV